MSQWMKEVAIGVIAGMGLAAWLFHEAIVIGLLLTAGGIAFIALISSRQQVFHGIALVVAFWGGIFLYVRSAEHWQGLAGEVQFSGLVEIIDRGETRVFYQPVALRPVANDWTGGDILYRAAIDFIGQPGERIDFSCQLKRPENFSSDFDYRMFLASRGIGYACERGGHFEASVDRGVSGFRRILFLIRSDFESRVSALLPEPESGLLAGLLVGGGDRLVPEIRDAFARAGLSHIVAVSGYNMSIVAEGLVILALGLGLWRRWAVIVAVIGLIFFLLVIDSSAASFRAALMAWLAFGAYLVGRPAASWNGLLIAGAIMLVANPLLIRYDVGFQLSFLATLALLVFARHFETFGFFHHWYGKAAALFLTTITIELFTLPVIVGAFGTLSLVAPLANAFILPLVPIAMFTGLAAIAFTSFIPTIGFLVLPFAWLPLAVIIRSAEIFSGVPWATLSGLDSSPVFTVVWYVSLGAVFFGLEKIRKRYALGMGH